MKPVCIKCDIPMIECPVSVSTFAFGGGYSHIHIDTPSGKGVKPFAYVCPRCGLVQLYVKIRKKEK